MEYYDNERIDGVSFEENSKVKLWFKATFHPEYGRPIEITRSIVIDAEDEW
jgi:hypothetical protein